MLPELSVVIAAYNEEKRLPATLGRIRDYLGSEAIRAEIVVVDDGSSDRTAPLVRGLGEGARELRLISYPRNRGKGYALRRGVLSSRGELVLVTDADLSTPIEELETLKAQITPQTTQIAIGSRALALSNILEAQPVWRRGMSRLFNQMVKSLVLQEYRDTQCGFKLFTGDVARRLFLEAEIDRFAYDVEILALARKYGYRVAEVPISWRNSGDSKVRPLLDSAQMLVDLLRIRSRLALPVTGPELEPIEEELDSESVN